MNKITKHFFVLLRSFYKKLSNFIVVSVTDKFPYFENLDLIVFLGGSVFESKLTHH